jgi:hypothetical protein
MNKLGLFFFVVFAATRIIFAQEDEAPAPIITSPTDHMKWTMKVETEGAAPSPEMLALNAPKNAWKAKEWNFTRGGKLIQIFVTFGSGVTQEFWRLRGLTLVDNPHLHSVNFQSDGGSPPYPKATDGFWGIQNVKPSDDQGKKDFEGISYHYFRSVSPTAGPSSPEAKVPASVSRFERFDAKVIPFDPSWEAWFDLKTGLPKAFKQNGETLVFQFSPEIPGDLQLPPRFQAAWDAANGGPIK